MKPLSVKCQEANKPPKRSKGPHVPILSPLAVEFSQLLTGNWAVKPWLYCLGSLPLVIHSVISFFTLSLTWECYFYFQLFPLFTLRISQTNLSSQVGGRHCYKLLSTPSPSQASSWSLSVAPTQANTAPSFSLTWILTPRWKSKQKTAVKQKWSKVNHRLRGWGLTLLQSCWKGHWSFLGLGYLSPTKAWHETEGNGKKWWTSEQLTQVASILILCPMTLLEIFESKEWENLNLRSEHLCSNSDYHFLGVWSRVIQFSLWVSPSSSVNSYYIFRNFFFILSQNTSLPPTGTDSSLWAALRPLFIYMAVLQILESWYILHKPHSLRWSAYARTSRLLPRLQPICQHLSDNQGPEGETLKWGNCSISWVWVDTVYLQLSRFTNLYSKIGELHCK